MTTQESRSMCCFEHTLLYTLHVMEEEDVEVEEEVGVKVEQEWDDDVILRTLP
ncbi:hypothetical protein DPMN_065286 [Dreissena polymorpha]|uniref:Uncharacterized protein n=1 Tax=Dreissena polymorpha TaxID=45954 RepID=A0A9D4HLX2_DREPO|nr:hypothetical protein DPMN_065286 [Dreissena polymorpha]